MRTIDTGNADRAGAASRGWFVGDLAAWAAQRGEAPDEPSTPRQSRQVQVKWLTHPPADERSGWAEPDPFYTLSLLVEGEMRLEFRSTGGDHQSVHLSRRGDYVIWYGPAYSHSWRTAAGCIMLTVRWPVEEAPAG